MSAADFFGGVASAACSPAAGPPFGTGLLLEGAAKGSSAACCACCSCAASFAGDAVTPTEKGSPASPAGLAAAVLPCSQALHCCDHRHDCSRLAQRCQPAPHLLQERNHWQACLLKHCKATNPSGGLCHGEELLREWHCDCAARRLLPGMHPSGPLPPQGAAKHCAPAQKQWQHS